MKSLDLKLQNIRNGQYGPEDFIIADAKDADMAYGLMAPPAILGEDGTVRSGNRASYLQAMREMTGSGVIDILLASASSGEILAREQLFADSPVTLAVRCNDTTDIWYPRGARYGKSPSRPFRTAHLERVKTFSDLGLYSITFSNDLEHDMRTLEAYAAFRDEACDLGLRHFLEVFNPAFDVGIAPDQLGFYIADSIVRCLAGTVTAEQPLFLKLAYLGRPAMEQLAAYDPTRLVVGILGGPKGTTRDTFELLGRAERAGARVALFGRKINHAEDPLTLVALMREVLQQSVGPEEAVRAYHAGLEAKNIHPALPLAEDLELTDAVLRAEVAA